ncbi:DUF3949 domain-containing protein [Gracilibacillus thailandensis]|jgi:hypothetical protein|uniref:DUF3949 domain-containing protein n=1 Tax=Gracilibacillus thailandensis TaxID=563735 RepID=A0A6N7R3N9_9BACI|nr:DUF3949 domain-containing protein [Gracilibacillus thailandensis]MRI67826.1 DUF3949 domain-containing protein [Gracilibacillus thailandensis]
MGALGAYLLLSLVLVPFQYRYLTGVKEEQIRCEQNQSEYYNSKSVAEQILHANTQGNPVFILANVMAYIIYKLKQK